MTNLEALTLFTSGVRLTVLAFLIVTLTASIRKVSTPLERIAHNSRYMLYAILILLSFTLLELAFEIVDHFNVIERNNL